MAEDNNNQNDNSEYEQVCYLCRRPESKAGKMIHIPNNICICADCMQKTFDSMGNMNGFPGMMGGMPPYMDMFTGGPNGFEDIPQNQKLKKKKKEEKRGVKSTTIKVKDEKTGEVVEKNISASEMNKRRLEYARQQDAERYKDERTVPLSELQNKKED